MSKPRDNPFPWRKDLYRIWFEFYKLACTSRDPVIRNSVQKSKSFYSSWGDVGEQSFDAWWRTHSHLFTEATVKVIDDISQRQTDWSVVVEIPLNQSSRVLVQKVKEIIDYELGRQSKRSQSRSKKKVIVTKNFVPTRGAESYSEPKVAVLREVLNIYKNVYRVSPSLRGKALLLRVHDYYKSRKVNQTIPASIANHKTESERTLSLRNLRRWISWAQKIEANAARGEFPGVYG
jgi:hypothetical protein